MLNRMPFLTPMVLVLLVQQTTPGELSQPSRNRPAPKTTLGLIEQLEDADPALRGAALLALSARTDPADLPTLVAALLGASLSKRLLLLEVLDHFDDPRKIGPLIETVRTFDQRVADLASRQLTRLGPPAAEALLGAAVACPRHADSEAFGEWAGSLAGAIGGSEFPDLRRAIASPLACSRRAAALAFTSAIIETLRNGSDATPSRRALEALAADDDPGVADVARLGVEQIERLEDGLGSAGDLPEDVALSEVAALSEGLSAKDARKRIAAIESAAAADLTDGTSLLVKAMGDPEPSVRLAIVVALSTINGRPGSARDERARDPVGSLPAVAMASRDNDPRVRQAAAEALMNLGIAWKMSPGSEAALGRETLLRLIDDPDPRVAEAGARAAGDVGEPTTLVPLTRMARHSDPGLRAAAIGALGSLRDDRAATALVAALKDPVPRVRHAASTSLDRFFTDGRRPGPDLVEPLMAALADPDTRDGVVSPLGLSRDPRAVAPLAANLTLPTVFVWCHVCNALGDIGDQAAVGPLVRYLVTARSPQHRAGAARALGRIGAAGGLSALTLALKDPDVEIRRSSAEALGLIGDRRALSALREARTDESAAVRAAVVAALARFDVGDR